MSDDDKVNATPARPSLKFDADAFQNPYPMYARLREADPVHRNEHGGLVLTRYADLVSALKDPHLGRGGMEARIQAAHGLGEQRMYILPMMFADPPEHTRLRGLLSRAFTLRVVEALVPLIERTANELLDQADAKGSLELVEDLAYTLPITTICSLLGMPTDDHVKIHALSHAHSAAMASGGLREDTKEVIQEASRLRIEWAEYFRKLAEERRLAPKEDLISALVRVHDGTDKLTEYELIATVVGLLFAGHTTTADTIGSGVLALLQHRDQWELLVREPAHLDSAVEEVLRWDPALQMYARVALEDTAVAGAPVPKGQSVVAVAGAANRDPAQFPDPERFDITRTPNRHVTFGSGIHFCMGSTLARVQVKAALSALRARYPKLALRGAPPTFRKNAIFRGLERLELATS